MVALAAVVCLGSCRSSYLVQDLDAAALGLPQPVRTVTCPRHGCGARAEFDAAAWLGAARRPERSEVHTLPTGTLDLRAGARPLGAPTERAPT